MSVHCLDDVNEQQLLQCSFVERKGLSDHSPPGMKLASDELAKRFFKCTKRPSNLHVREFGKFNQRYPLLFRDYLRSHPDSAAYYGKIKLELAKKVGDDPDAYYDIRDPVTDLIMVAAAEWGQRIAWSEPQAD
ncbi:hypothetical protein V1525DRAFT_404600 [Lipomyces kononenkoae]|uniref:Uncharacterized protein n=1 Tax=Lipomyces kononenkoae TaxID=34357 RepID=A0ACC3T0T5_LIPKO